MYAVQLAERWPRRILVRLTVVGLLVGSAICGAGAAGPALREASRSTENSWRQAYVRDFESGVRRARLSEIDTNDLMSALTGELPPQRHLTDLERLASLASLQQISATIIELRELHRTLQERYGLRRPPSRGADYIGVIDPEAPPRTIEPVMDSWARLGIAFQRPPIIVTRTRSSPVLETARRWRRPIRIASTGNDEDDSQVATVVEELRRSNSNLPLDDLSFPNAVGQANVFLDLNGILCPERAPCRPFDTGPALRSAIDEETQSSSQRNVLAVLAAFDQLRQGRWIPGAEIVPLDASSGLALTAAWLRTDSEGEIATAICTNVTSRGAQVLDRNEGSTSAGRPGATTDEIRRSIRACLGAAMGAPSTLPQWSVRMVPYRGNLCCPNPAIRPDSYSQDELLRQIYR